ncbi:MAG: formylglycine-generating enzyme family protein, partial [Candidatus Omnitrophica bacterium]|nr:formylglycine-generating enzyme family protein [Candidatus Omnitrophota bacterium]
MKTHLSHGRWLVYYTLVGAVISSLGLELATADSVATATAFVVNGFVVAINITSGGSGYTIPPPVTLVGGGGIGAKAEAVISMGSVTDIRVLNAGSGYTSNPTVVIAPPRVTFIESIQSVPLLTLRGDIGTTNQIKYINNVDQTNSWLVLTNIVLASDPYYFVDLSATQSPQRYYQVVTLPEAEGPLNPNPSRLVWIPAGTFLMGSPTNETDRDSDEGPQTQVTISQSFWIGKYEVTQGEYQELMGNNPSGFIGDSNRPVDSVLWSSATNYCGKLTDRERAVHRLPDGYVYRLPTEAEWEFAARALTTSRFSFGDDPNYTQLGSSAWYSSNSDGISHSVGTKQPNPWGLYDILGNVAEWTLDQYEEQYYTK